MTTAKQVLSSISQIRHQILFYRTAWICGPQEVNFRKIIFGHFNDL